MHGCGLKLTTDNSEATQQAGQFIEDEYVGPSNVCSVAAAQQAAQGAVAAAHLASGLQVCCCHHCASTWFVFTAAHPLARVILMYLYIACSVQEKEGAEGLKVRPHQSYQGLKVPSHASAFNSLVDIRTQFQTGQDARSQQ